MLCQNIIDLGDNFIIIIVCKLIFIYIVQLVFSVNGRLHCLSICFISVRCAHFNGCFQLNIPVG